MSEVSKLIGVALVFAPGAAIAQDVGADPYSLVSQMRGSWEGTLTALAGTDRQLDLPTTIEVVGPPGRDSLTLTLVIRSPQGDATERYDVWRAREEARSRVTYPTGGVYEPRVMAEGRRVVLTVTSEQNDDEGALRTEFWIGGDGALMGRFANQAPASGSWNTVWTGTWRRVLEGRVLSYGVCAASPTTPFEADALRLRAG